MIGVDTNIIVRLLTRDDEKQFLKSREIFAKEQVFISDTVILETEWVLRFAYGFKPDDIRLAFSRLFGLDSVHLNNPDNLAMVLKLYKSGLDFADAMHLVANNQQETFLTIDKTFIRRAKGLTDCLIKSP